MFPHYFSVLFFVIICYVGTRHVECGVYGRSSQQQQQQQQQGYNSNTGRLYNGSPKETTLLGKASSNNLLAQKQTKASSAGMSAWGIITLIMLVILLGMGAYYGMLCYPIICSNRSNNYDIMDAASTSSGTPTRSTEFEKLGNYSSRSTTPSKSHE